MSLGETPVLPAVIEDDQDTYKHIFFKKPNLIKWKLMQHSAGRVSSNQKNEELDKGAFIVQSAIHNYWYLKGDWHWFSLHVNLYKIHPAKNLSNFLKSP